MWSFSQISIAFQAKVSEFFLAAAPVVRVRDALFLNNSASRQKYITKYDKNWYV